MSGACPSGGNFTNGAGGGDGLTFPGVILIAGLALRWFRWKYHPSFNQATLHLQVQKVSAEAISKILWFNTYYMLYVKVKMS